MLALTRLLTLVQVGVCRRYALEAIINVIIYLHVCNYVYIPCYNCNGSRVCNNHEARRKTHMHVWNNKRIKYIFLVSPLRLAQVLHDGSVFLIMGMTMPATLRAQCWKNTCVVLTQLMLCYEIHSSPVNGL